MIRTRSLPSTSTFTVPSGSFSSCSTLASTPTRKMPSSCGSSSEASFWLASRICLSSFITASSARTDLLAADEQRHDHVREHHDVAQRQNRVGLTAQFRHFRCPCTGRAPGPGIPATGRSLGVPNGARAIAFQVAPILRGGPAGCKAPRGRMDNGTSGVAPPTPCRAKQGGLRDSPDCIQDCIQLFLLHSACPDPLPRPAEDWNSAANFLCIRLILGINPRNR